MQYNCALPKDRAPKRRWRGLCPNEHVGPLRRSVADALMFSKIEAGELELNEEHVCLPTLVKDIVNQTGATSPVSIAQDNSCTGRDYVVCADKERLTGVIQELLTSALRFCGGNALTVRLHAGVAGNRVRLEVRSDGQEFDDDDMDNIFDALSQSNNLYAATRNEIGLGLALQKRIANEMRMDLGVSSQLKLGSAFWLDVTPLSPAEPLFPSVNHTTESRTEPEGVAVD
jgi:signal transduction histidine kinase